MNTSTITTITMMTSTNAAAAITITMTTMMTMMTMNTSTSIIMTTTSMTTSMTSHDHDHCCGHHHHHHHADEVFTSWGTETPRKYTDDEIRTALDALINEHRYGVVLRAKGIVPATDGGWIHFDYVPGESDVRRGSAQVTGRVCVIGSHLAEDALKELFHIG